MSWLNCNFEKLPSKASTFISLYYGAPCSIIAGEESGRTWGWSSCLSCPLLSWHCTINSYIIRLPRVEWRLCPTLGEFIYFGMTCARFRPASNLAVNSIPPNTIQIQNILNLRGTNHHTELSFEIYFWTWIASSPQTSRQQCRNQKYTHSRLIPQNSGYFAPNSHWENHSFTFHWCLSA